MVKLASKFTQEKQTKVSKLAAGLKSKGIKFAADEERVKAIPTGIKEIDEYLIGGIGGIPRGRITELSGFESTGKSYFLYYLIARVQEQGGVAALLDGEWSYDKVWGKQFGIDNSRLMLGHYDSAEEHYDQLAWLLSRKNPDLIGSDSVASLVPNEYTKLGVDKMSPAKIAWETAKLNKLYLRLIFTGWKKYDVKLPETNTALIFINHLSDKIGDIYGDNYDTGGGRAVKFWSHLRLRLLPAGFGKERDRMGNPIEMFVNFKVMKSRLGEPGKKVQVKLDWKGGIEAVRTEEVFIIALENNLIEYNNKGGIITFNWEGDDYKIKGKKKYIDFCDQNEEYKEFVLGSGVNGNDKDDEKDSGNISKLNI